MLHYAEIKKGRFETKPVSATCSCSTAGDFATVDEARAWIEGHFRNLSGIDTTELHVADDELKQEGQPTPAPAPKPEPPPPPPPPPTPAPGRPTPEEVVGRLGQKKNNEEGEKETLGDA